MNSKILYWANMRAKKKSSYLRMFVTGLIFAQILIIPVYLTPGNQLVWAFLTGVVGMLISARYYHWL